MTDLLDYLAETEIGDLGSLAVITGVDYETLRLVSEGRAKLGMAHLDAITRAIPNFPRELLEAHVAPVPIYGTTRRGSVPADRRFTISAAEEVVATDLVAYHPPNPGSGSHWLPLTREPEIRGFLVVLELGGVESSFPRETLLRVARVKKEASEGASVRSGRETRRDT